MAASHEGSFHCANAAGEIMSVTLVLGGARSGKSRFAESLAVGRLHYVATAQAFDDEMRSRIALHQRQRGQGWTTHEEVYDVPQRLRKLNDPLNFILVDCLTLWLSNLMLADRDVTVACEALLSELQHNNATIVLVSNEVGLGIVPDSPLGRAFRDEQGRLNQQVANVADDVVFIAAGLPLVLKGQLPRSAPGRT
jgi:adenosylcobinamide kinase / adenosylcobinamide-phosphate guanylyltransferase